MTKFVQSIVAFSLKNSVIVFFLTALLLVAGIVSYIHTPIEAFPDVTNTRARIITQWPGRSAEEVEKFVTLPVMKEMNTIPKKTKVRSISLFGLSVVTVIFDDSADDFFAQQYASNRLRSVELPDGAEAEIEPPSGATGEIFRYVVKSDRPIKDITAIHDWVIERELVAVPGVADIVSFGGEEKIYEIQIHPTELSNYGLSPLDVYEAVSKSNINVGGDIIEQGDQAYVVRGVGLLESVRDIENILIEVKGSTPVMVKHVAEVKISAKPRLGQVGLQDDDDLVQGIVIMLRGENPGGVITSLKEKIKELNERILPGDVKIEPFIDRTELVDVTVHTVTKNLVEGIILVSLIVFIFLYNWRMTLIVASVIPLAFLFAITMLRIIGMPANLISMGALDFGLLLEGALVIAERVFVGLEQKAGQVGMERFNKMSKLGIIKNSAKNVASYIFFALFILIVALLPIFSFQKVEGKMFSPLAYTLGFALLGSLILSLTYVPAMCKVLLTKNIREKNNVVTRSFRNGLFNLYLWTAKYKKATIASFCVLLLACIAGFYNHGSEFLPKLNEGAVYVRATLPNSINLEESVRLTKEMKDKIRKFDEVKFVLTQTGRPNDGTDPTGFFNIEFHIELFPEKEWKRNIDKEELIDELRQTLQSYSGIVFGFSQPIQDNVEEYVAGVKSSLVVKIFGDDLFELEDYADQVASSLKNVRGIKDLNVYRNIGLPELRIQLHDHKLSRYAVDISDAQAVIAMAIGGQAATTFYEDERMFDVRLRFARDYRDTDEKIGEILIPTKDGKRVPLKEIATIDFHTGPAFIYREGSSRYIGVGFSIEDRDLGSTVAEAEKVVGENVKFPGHIKTEWAGEFESKERATRQLYMIVPVCLLLIMFLLWMNFEGNLKDTLVSFTVVPFAFIGGYLSLLVTGTTFGISAGIGFIILFGVATIDGIVLIGNIRQRIRRHIPLKEAISQAVYSRIRPVLMIALMGSLGLLPAALSTGMGSEIQKPLAIMIVGGLIVCMILSITVLPQVFYFAYREKPGSREQGEEITEL
ncbi:efflux RND transporter permease subunit [Sinomicrobium weinanense]|uniref:Efflux RND transporter permease subunit n=1 Tax=Sinomicrobium weinanense TaxID=2842200 RepID=A0A926JUI0_9FLAO|nr:CusA/CzcA family heavy metal efflux RND transporter [Sinomicrobium weinanense]MBC9797611.1 efflux RND transporter permease subunit [Sinomicrobium weinanense]MBU3123433.1 CusA/CzcA family heavy metal efflux RND transporter [Sinomicrobium weinanense]